MLQYDSVQHVQNFPDFHSNMYMLFDINYKKKSPENQKSFKLGYILVTEKKFCPDGKYKKV